MAAEDTSHARSTTVSSAASLASRAKCCLAFRAVDSSPNGQSPSLGLPCDRAWASSHAASSDRFRRPACCVPNRVKRETITLVSQKKVSRVLRSQTKNANSNSVKSFLCGFLWSNLKRVRKYIKLPDDASFDLLLDG